ncbi:MAG: L-aspartate oxidase [Candidatus Eisenbacteria bacterium]|nr:L-aspartate oxidase [Candidatus Eisenbacteria bacterium]
MQMREYEFLVIGSGLAGLTFALETAEAGRVAILTKREAWDTNTWLAQGGVASVLAPDDSFERHARDTVEAGGGLCDAEVVRTLVAEGPAAIESLERLGVRFSQQEDGDGYDLGREGGHSRRRVLHVTDETGRAIEQVLLDRVRAHPRIDLFEHHCVVDLITTSKLAGTLTTRGDTAVVGAYVLDVAGGEILRFAADQTLLATGGCGKVYRYTSNPDVASGDGLAMAHRAGARLADLEFVQFHPTCLFHPRERRFLISEAVRGEGAVLRAIGGEAFMQRYHSRAELAPRDVVARAIDSEMKSRGEAHVLLDLSPIGAERVKRRFPMIYGTCLALGIDLTREPAPVVPAAHYMCGGIVADIDGRTDLRRLFVAGEAACTGLHGANRLASNSLLESVVCARRAARAAIEGLAAGRASREIPPWDPGSATLAKESVLVNSHWTLVRALMWDFVGIVRSDHRLELARRYIHFFRESIESYYWDFLLDSDLIELRNLALIADLIIGCARARRESRGLHYNADHPTSQDERWRRHTVVDPLSGRTRMAGPRELPFGASAQARDGDRP